MCFALNVGRAGVVLEDGNAPGSDNMPFCVLVDVEDAVVCTVPDVLHMTQANAETEINNAGFEDSNSHAKHDTEPAGQVYAQSPSGGAEPNCGTTVHIDVSDGPCIVPDVVGDPNLVAQAAIIAAGFDVGTIDDATSGTVPRGSVISTSPATGAAACGSAVDITLSSGCFPSADPNYQAWLDVNEPNCWCYPRQCHGDADNVESTYGPAPPPIMPWPKAWVTDGLDSDLLVAGYKQAYSGDPTVDTWICADYNRQENTYGPAPPPIMPWPKAHVTSEDMDIWVLYYKAASVPPNCQ